MQKPTECMVLHADLFVSSMSAALEFYCEKLGFSVVDDAILRGPIVVNLSRGAFDEVRLVLLQVSRSGALIELQEFQSASGRKGHTLDLVPQRSLVTFLVANLAAHVERTQRGGLQPSSEIFVVDLPKRGRCKVIFYDDPDGNRLEFIEAMRPQR
jgi:catechol 2,3-dioxygenase-like lactoylglutathione lyase family enzyme